MLYTTLRFVAGVALRWYYREVSIRGAERIPRSGPVILAVNHPNALVDAMVVAWLVPRRVRITAKAVLFENPALRVLLRAVGVIPLRRASDELAKRRHPAPEPPAAVPVQAPVPDPARNAAAFTAILDALDAGAALLIFPEGKSHDEPALAQLRTGPARIALTAREEGRAPGLRIVPMGLVFDAKEAVRSRVVAVVGDPIDMRRWAPPSDSPSAPEALTREIADRLQQVVLTAPTADRLALVQRMAHLVGAILAPAAPAVGAGPPLRDEYAIAVRVANGMDRLSTLPTDLRVEAEAALDGVEAFGRALEAAAIAPTDASISLRRRHGARFVVRELALLACAGLLALFGRLTHWIPFRLARRAALRDVTSRDQPAMRTIVVGLALVLASYAVQAAVVGVLAGWPVALSYLVLLPIGADVDLRYTDRLRLAWRRMTTYLRLRRDPGLAARLAAQRAALADAIGRLDAGLAAWDAASGRRAGRRVSAG